MIERIKAAMAAGSKLIIVRDDDELLATYQASVVAEACCQPVSIVSALADDMQDRLGDHPQGMGTLIIKGSLPIYGENAAFVRALREVALQTRQDGEASSRLILIETRDQDVPSVLRTDADIIDAQLPSVSELGDELDALLKSKGIDPAKMPENVRFILASSVSGMGRHEAARLFSKSMVVRGKLDAAWLRSQKAESIAQRLNGALSFEKGSDEESGGLDALKRWLSSRMAAFNNPKAKSFGLDEPKGLLIVGAPGTGKSLTAKTVARKAGLPLLRLDIGKMFGSLVGQSESQARAAIAAAEACAPCVLWIDEIEKAFGQGGADGGTSQRVFGTILTWLNDKTSPVFVVATANKVEALPPELLRKGRFDEIFYVGNPVKEEREEIIRIHLSRKGWTFTDKDVSSLAIAAKGFNGAELAESVKAGMFVAFSENRGLAFNDVLNAIKETVPLSKTMGTEIKRLESWADGRARRASSLKDSVSGGRYAMGGK